MNNTFSIRLAQEAKGDIQFILHAHDTAVDYLNKTVNSSQWGNELFSKRQKAIDGIKRLVQDSEKGLEGDEFIQTYIAETQSQADDQLQSQSSIPCAAATIEAIFPDYVVCVDNLKEKIQSSLNKKDFLYLDRLVSDHNLGKVSKGSGKSVLDHCKQITLQKGKRFLYSDCFAGPPLGLRQYYQSQGFKILGEFGVPNKHVDGTDWPGVLLCCDLKEGSENVNLDVYWQPDLTKPISDSFTYDIGGHGWGNEEVQTYTESSENSFIENDNTLVIRAIAKDGPYPQFTSARLISKQCLDLDRGYVEARIKTPQAKAIWYAFWLLPKQPFEWPGDGEIDICEGWDKKYENGNCLHWGHFNGQDYDKHRVRYHSISPDQNTTGHTYGFCWSNKGLIWFFDGKPTMRANVPNGIRPFADYQIMLNIAMGGNVMQNAIPDKPSSHEMQVRDLKICKNPPMGWSGFEEAWRIAQDGNTM